jgi:Uma2 family endonuclease
LAETQLHLDQIIYLFFALSQFFAAVPDVFVAADLLVYYKEGYWRQRVAPDVFVARGVRDAKAKRRSYRVWEEGALPEVIFEITSSSTRREDTTKKRALYQQLGVPEYFLFDPLGDYLRPRLQGYRLDNGEYAAIPPRADGSLLSERLGLEIHMRDGQIRLFDPHAQRWLRSAEEEATARDAETVARREAEERAAAAERELAHLRALLSERNQPS